jgi:hypothetical protein
LTDRYGAMCAPHAGCNALSAPSFCRRTQSDAKCAERAATLRILLTIAFVGVGATLTGALFPANDKS